MVIKSCTNEGDVVLILFGGSGAEIEVCKNLKRRFISAEINPQYYRMILDRIENGEIKDKYKLKIKKTMSSENSSYHNLSSLKLDL